MIVTVLNGDVKVRFRIIPDVIPRRETFAAFLVLPSSSSYLRVDHRRRTELNLTYPEKWLNPASYGFRLALSSLSGSKDEEFYEVKSGPRASPKEEKKKREMSLQG
jgi:hypothetical protein